MLQRHFDRINEIPKFKGSTKIFIPESNLANEGSHMANMIKKRPDVRTYWEKETKIGVHKSHSVTDDYQYMFDSKLKNNSMFFDDEFFTTSKGKTVESVKGQAREELERYHYDYVEPKTVHGKGSLKITGKMGSTMNDDLAIAILMGPYWGRIVLRTLDRLH